MAEWGGRAVVGWGEGERRKKEGRKKNNFCVFWNILSVYFKNFGMLLEVPIVKIILKLVEDKFLKKLRCQTSHILREKKRRKRIEKRKVIVIVTRHGYSSRTVGFDLWFRFFLKGETWTDSYRDGYNLNFWFWFINLQFRFWLLLKNWL